MRAKRTFLHIILLFIVMLCRGEVYGVPHFAHFTTNGRAVYAFCRDKEGILWLGTSKGLMTYAQLQSQMRITFHYNEAMNDIIQAIREDNVGRLWMKTQSNRYLAYNPYTNECITDVDNYLRQFGMHLKYQFFCHIDGRGRLWVYKGRDIYLIDFKTSKKQHFAVPASAGDIASISDNGRQAVIVARNAIYTSALNASARVWLRFYARPMIPMDDPITRSLLGTNGMLWIASDMKLMRYDPAEKRWHLHKECKPDITDMIAIPSGVVCIATTNAGIFAYDAKGKLIENLRQQSMLIDGLQNSHVEALYYDRLTKSMLISYHKHDFSALFPPQNDAIRKYHIQSAANSYATEDVITFATDGSNILAGTEDSGVYHLTAGGPILGNDFRGSAATAILRDRSGKLWAGLYRGGLACSDGRKFFPNESPYKIIEIAKNRFFVLLNGEGIWTLDPVSGKAKHIPTDNPWIMDMVRYRDKIYAATPKHIYVIDTRTLGVKAIDASRLKNSGFSEGNKTMTVDSRGWLWLVNYKANSPIDIFDTRTSRFLQIRDMKRYAIAAIESDSRGNVWATTDKGLVKITVRGNAHPTFTQTLYNDNSLFNDRALFNLGNGRMAAGCSDGYIIFMPDRMTMVSDKNVDCPLILASLHINGNNIVPGQKADGRAFAVSDLPYVKTLDLPHEDNNIIMEFLPRGIEESGRNTWSYNVKGITNGFVPLINGDITLTNLPSGTYDVLLRMNNDSWQGHDYKVMTIHVAPPLWLSWWAIALYVIALSLLCLFIYHYQLRSMQITFFKKVSHDLRTPLTLVIAPVEELLNRVNDKAERNILETAYRNALYLMTLINQILDYRRINPKAADRQAQTLAKLPQQEHHDKTVLIVDDNTDILSFLAEALSGEYTICQATDGKMALQVLSTTDVDLIVSDVTMAGMDGLELCRRVRSDISTSHIPVILLTARAMDDDQLKGLQVGADDYITKPFNIDILKQRIRNILTRMDDARERFDKNLEVKSSDIAVTTLDEEFMSRAIKAVEDNMSQTDFSVEKLAELLSMSRTTLFKKLQALTGKSPLLFIRSLRMKRARYLMSRGGVLVSQVAYEVGYNSPKLFSRHFKEEFGIYPSEELQKSKQ